MPTAGDHAAMARWSWRAAWPWFATATRQLLEVAVGRYDEGERAALLRTLGALKEDDVLVLDRGYPAWWMFALLQARNIAFCVRIEDCGWPVVRQFLAKKPR